MSENVILEARDLSVTFLTGGITVKALNGFDMQLRCGEILGLIGETGSGKSIAAQAMMRLLDDVAAVEGEVYLNGKSVMDFSEEEVREMRGKEIGYVPQSPGSSMNPVVKIGKQMSEFLQKVHGISYADGKQKCIDELVKAGLSPETYDQYPHQLSGGMQERALIATTTLVRPTILIADEPTKGLDSKSKEKVIQMLLCRDSVQAAIIVTHDLELAAMCDSICVMYEGEIIESGTAEEVMSAPMHPYTTGLIASHPKHGLKSIPRSLRDKHEGSCRFYKRCSMAGEECKTHPDMKKIGKSEVRCHYVGGR